MSQMGVLLQLACIVAFTLEIGNSEDLRISVELSRRDDGEVGASLYVANATRELFKNSSIFLDFHAFTDQTHKLIAASGYVKETNGKNAVELTCDATSKDEEIKNCQTSKETEIRKSRFLEKEISAREEDYNRLFLSHCSEEGQEFLDVFPREYVNAIRGNRTQEAKFVIVDGNGHLDGKDVPIELFPGAFFSSSFIRIHDNGSVHEISGREKCVEKGGLGSNYLLVEFVKENRDTQPSDKAIKTFKELLRTAVCSKVLSPNYYIIPFYLIGDYYSIGNESFERNALSKWIGYKDNLDFLVSSDSDENGKQPIVSNERFFSHSLSQFSDWFNISSPIEYLVVSNYGTRCFFNCEHTTDNHYFTSLFYRTILDKNFWVGEDGRAYEFLGWDMTTQRVYQSKKAVVATFMGHFNIYRPNHRIFDALDDLIEEGLRLGKLSPTFKIVSIRNPNANPTKRGVIGNSLEEEIRKHPRFSETF